MQKPHRMNAPYNLTEWGRKALHNKEQPASLTITKTITNSHHINFRCRDAKQTRQFWENTLGFPLVHIDISNRDIGLQHGYERARLFFRVKRNSHVSFVDAPYLPVEARFKPSMQHDRHIAFECNSIDELNRWAQRFEDRGIPCTNIIKHSPFDSIYVYDPNGILVEILCSLDATEEQLPKKNKSIDETLEEWTSKTASLKERRYAQKCVEPIESICAENLHYMVEQAARSNYQ